MSIVPSAAPPVLRVVKEEARPATRTAVGTLPPAIPATPVATQPEPLPPPPTVARIETGRFSNSSSDGRTEDASWASHLSRFSLESLASGELGSVAAEPDYFSDEEKAAIAEQMAQQTAPVADQVAVPNGMAPSGIPVDGAYEALELSWFDEDIDTALERSPDEFAPDESRAVAFFSKVFSRIRGK